MVEKQLGLLEVCAALRRWCRDDFRTRRVGTWKETKGSRQLVVFVLSVYGLGYDDVSHYSFL
jgi:hypothetical protein